MDKEFKKKMGQYNVDITHMKADYVLKLVNYAIANELDIKSVIQAGTDNLGATAIKSLDTFERIIDCGNLEDVTAAIKRANNIREEKLRNGDF